MKRRSHCDVREAIALFCCPFPFPESGKILIADRKFEAAIGLYPHYLNTVGNMNDLILQVTEQNGDLVVDSRLIAARLNIEHESFMRFVVAHFGQAKANLTVLDLLGIRARCFTYSDYELGFALDKIIELIIGSDFLSNDSRTNLTWMFAAIKYEALNNWGGSIQELGGVHAWFKRNHTIAIPDSKLIKVKPKDKKRPDFLVEINTFVHPVECKIEFTNQSLKQLMSYMKLWGSKTGFAVAYSLKCTLPSNIFFLQAS